MVYPWLDIFFFNLINGRVNPQDVENVSNLTADQLVLYKFNDIIHTTQTQINGGLSTTVILLSDSVTNRIQAIDLNNLTWEQSDHYRNQAARLRGVLHDMSPMVESAVSEFTSNQDAYNTALSNAPSDVSSRPFVAVGGFGAIYGCNSGNNAVDFTKILVNQHMYLIDSGKHLIQAINEFSNPNSNVLKPEQFKIVFESARRFVSVLSAEQSIITRILESSNTTGTIHPNTPVYQGMTGMFGSSWDLTGLLPYLGSLEDFILFRFL